MFDLGTQELIVIFIVAFLVFGPKKLPELGRTLGKGLRELKAAMRGVQNSFEEAGSGVTNGLKDVKNDLEDSIYKSIESGIENGKGGKKPEEEKTPGKEENMPLFDEEVKKEGVKKPADKETDKDG